LRAGAERSTFNVQGSTFGVQRSAFNVWRLAFGVWRRELLSGERDNEIMAGL
jgi:hypothetical protein